MSVSGSCVCVPSVTNAALVLPRPEDSTWRKTCLPRTTVPVSTRCRWGPAALQHLQVPNSQPKWELPGSPVRLGRAEATKLPKATSGHPPVTLTSRDSLEKGCLEVKWGVWVVPVTGRRSRMANGLKWQGHPPLREKRPAQGSDSRVMEKH